MSAIVAGRRRIVKLAIALLLAAAVSTLPVVSSHSGLFAQPVQAGCPQGGSCG